MEDCAKTLALVFTHPVRGTRVQGCFISYKDPSLLEISSCDLGHEKLWYRFWAVYTY